MVQWVNRSLVQAPRNGTTTHTVAFTPASAGNLLVAVAEGAVTSSTPTGWTLPAGGSAVNNTGLYVWYKTATSGEASFTTTHNGSNYPVGFVVYEFPAGSAFVKAVSSTGGAAGAANPNLTGLTGTNLLYGAAAVDNGGVGTNVSAVWSGTGAPVEDLDVSVLPSGTDGYWLGVAYVESSTAASFQPTATVSNSTTTKEALTFAVNVATTTPVTTATGTAGVSVGLTGAASVLVVAAGSLALGLALSGTAVPVAVATGALPLSAGLTGAATIPTVPALTGTLPAALSLTGVANIVALTTGTLPLTLDMSGTALNPSTERDLWLTVAPLPERWAAHPLPSRWATTPVPPRWVTAPLENRMATTILASAGEKQYVGGTITELTGKDISADTFQIALGDIAIPPTSWATPDVSIAGATAAQRVVKLLVSSTTAPGIYWCWVKISDNPEVKPLIVQGPITIA